MRKILGLKTRQAKKLVVCFVFMLVFLPLSVSGATTVGNDVSVGGTLGVTGATTLTGALVANGAVTLGNAVTDNVTVNGYVVSDLIIYNATGKQIDIGDGTTTSTFEKDNLTLGYTAGYELGTFDVTNTGDVSASGTFKFTAATNATSTLLIDATGGTGKGSCFVLKDVAGTTKYLTILTGNTVDISTVDCRN